MGKTSRPLTIVALPPCNEWEELTKLEEQGHTVIRNLEDLWKHETVLEQADIVLGSNCWRMDSKHKSYLSLAIKEARMLKYNTNEDRQSIKKRAIIVSSLDPVTGPSDESS